MENWIIAVSIVGAALVWQVGVGVREWLMDRRQKRLYAAMGPPRAVPFVPPVDEMRRMEDVATRMVEAVERIVPPRKPWEEEG